MKLQKREKKITLSGESFVPSFIVAGVPTMRAAVFTHLDDEDVLDLITILHLDTINIYLQMPVNMILPSANTGFWGFGEIGRAHV